jgi:hypothetical protein
LVVSIPLKNMSSSVGMIIPNIWKVIKFMFQTTNQKLFQGPRKFIGPPQHTSTNRLSLRISAVRWGANRTAVTGGLAPSEGGTGRGKVTGKWGQSMFVLDILTYSYNILLSKLCFNLKPIPGLTLTCGIAALVFLASHLIHIHSQQGTVSHVSYLFVQKATREWSKFQKTYWHRSTHTKKTHIKSWKTLTNMKTHIWIIVIRNIFMDLLIWKWISHWENQPHHRRITSGSWKIQRFLRFWPAINLYTVYYTGFTRW